MEFNKELFFSNIYLIRKAGSSCNFVTLSRHVAIKDFGAVAFIAWACLPS